MLNLPNQLTLSRIVLALLCIGFLLSNTYAGLVVSFCIFAFASLTDFLDGFLARRKNMVSDLGRIIDPIADKVLIIGVFLALVAMNVVSLWMVVVIVLREFLITGLRAYALGKGRVLSAQRFGKHKTFSQMAGIVIIFTLLIMEKKGVIPWALSRTIVFFTVWWIVLITVSSGMVYFWSNRELIKTF